MARFPNAAPRSAASSSGPSVRVFPLSYGSTTSSPSPANTAAALHIYLQKLMAELWRRAGVGSSPALRLRHTRWDIFAATPRDGFSLAPEDLEILDRIFPGLAQVALLIKPYATKVSVGGFFIREHGEFPETTPLEFPLRRGALLGEEPVPRRPLTEAGLEGRGERPVRAITAFPQEPPRASPSIAIPEPAPPPDIEGSRPSRNWVWLPLICLFLLLGGALGYEVALTMGARAAASAAQDLSLSLSVKKIGDNLRLSWSPLSPAVRSAQRGLLEIDDGGYTRPVTLDAAQLQNGSLIYRSVSNSVRFRMTVFPQARVSVVETLEWKQ